MLTDMGLVERTWQEVGYKVKALRKVLFVRTLPLEQKSGMIWLPPKATSFHGELPHQKTINAVVLSAGSQSAIKPGEIVSFTRLYFAWLKRLEDGCMFGWIDENQIHGYVEEL